MSSYEEKTIELLKKSKIKFIREKTFKDLKNGNLRFDFYIPDKNTIIEIDGQYHW